MAMATGSNQFQIESSVDVISLTADLTNGNFAGGTTQLTNTDGYPKIRMTLSCPNGFLTGTWDTNPSISLWCTKLNIDGTSDEVAPSGTDAKGAHYVGLFAIDNHGTSTTPQYRQIVISALNADEMNFHIRNDTGLTLDYSATAITVGAELMTNGPKPA